MKALVKTANGKGNLEIREVEIPKCKNNEALLKVKAAAICGSDILRYTGRIKIANPPVILGHEISGVIAELPKGAKGLREGDRVSVEANVYACGKCQSCKAGMENMCLKRVGIGYQVDGGFAEHVKVPVDMLIPIPEDISFEEASLMDICVAVHAVHDRSSLRKNDHVVIMGPGFLGLSILQLCKLKGAASVIVVGIEKDAKRLELAKKLGADEVVQIEKTDLMQVVQSRINTAEVDGVDVVFEVSGSKGGLVSAIRVVRRGGSMTLIGSIPELVEAPILNVINRQVTLYGSRAYTRRNCEQAFEYLSDGKIELQPMISGKFPLEKWKEAFELLQEGEAVKIILQP